MRSILQWINFSLNLHQSGTGDLLKIFDRDKMDDLHYYSYIKFGIGRATYDACPEIRNGDLDEED